MTAPFHSPFEVEIDPTLGEVRQLLEANRRQLERELGAPMSLATGTGFEGGRWTIRLGGDRPRLVLDRAAQRLLTEGPDRRTLFETFSLLRDLHGHPGGELLVTDCASTEAAVDRIAAAVATTWPSFDLHGVDWAALTAEHRPKILAAADPIPELKAWLARLGDPHTAVRPVDPPGRLPYRAVALGERLCLTVVPAETAGRRAGARAGDELLGPDVERLRQTQAGRPHSHAALVALGALRGPAGQEVELATRSGVRWTEAYARDPWPHPVEVRRLPSGEGYIRLRNWAPAQEQALDAAMEALADTPHLVFDLRGNGGGDFAMACRFRGRFLEADRQVGWIQYTLPGGGLGERTPTEASAAPPRLRWGQPLTVWIDSETYSASEDFLMGLAEAPDTRVLGSPSGGGSGRLRVLRLLPGWRLTITTCHTFTNDGHRIEGSGHPVSGPVPS